MGRIASGSAALDPPVPAARRRNVRQRPPDEPLSPCERCHRAAQCAKPCPRLEALLPGPRRAEQYAPIPPEVADCAGDWRRALGQESRELFRIFLARRERLTAAQWRCVELLYGEGLGPREAARRLEVSHSAVVRHAAAARRRLLKGVVTVSRTGEATRYSGRAERKGAER